MDTLGFTALIIESRMQNRRKTFKVHNALDMEELGRNAAKTQPLV
jgi:hypothetical protein